jgi:AMP-polyphosphate phosphotransferase
MLELIDLNKRLSKEIYSDVFPKLEVRMGECQRAAKEAGVPLIVVFEGWDSSGKGTAINRLTQALDPRGFIVHPIKPPNETEPFYPWLWRFWNKLPAAGHIAIFDRSWYMRVLDERVEQTATSSEVREAYEDILQFERQLADSGAVIVKFWLHISRKEQRQRHKQLLNDPATAWTVGDAEQRQNRKYERMADGRRVHAGADADRERPLDRRRGDSGSLHPHQGLRDHHRRPGGRTRPSAATSPHCRRSRCPNPSFRRRRNTPSWIGWT